MTTSEFSIQYSFQLPKGHIIPVSLQSEDIIGSSTLSFGRFSSVQPPKQQPRTGNHEQQTRTKVYSRMVKRLAQGELPGREYAISYLRHQYRRNFTVATLKASVSITGLFLTFLKSTGRLRLEDITRRDIAAYIEDAQDRGLEIGGIKTKLGALYAFLNYLVKTDILPPEILDRKIRVKLPEALPRAIDPEDLKALLAAVTSVRDRALILLLHRTGMRIGELLKLTVTDIDLQERKVSLYIGEKNARGRVVYFCDDAKEALLAWLRVRDPRQPYLFPGHHNRPLSYGGASEIFKRALRAAGLAAKGYSLHRLRHTFASELLNAGLRLEVLQQLLGHTSIEITRRYARLTDKTREEEYFRAMQCIEKESADGHY
jgi:integrase/recombinase XerD